MKRARIERRAALAALLLGALPLLTQAQTPPATPAAVAPAIASTGASPARPVTHSDNWCADAVDFAMGAAQNRDLGYAVDVIAGSIERTPSYYQRMFENLSVADMQQIVETVYEHQWSRFQAAQGISESCIVQ